MCEGARKTCADDGSEPPTRPGNCPQRPAEFERFGAKASSRVSPPSSVGRAASSSSSRRYSKGSCWDPGRESQWSRGGVRAWPGRAAPRRIEAAVAPEGQLLWPWGWLSRCPRTVAGIVGSTRDRLPHAEEARGRFILDHDPAAAAQSDGPQLTATNQPPHELSR